MSDQVYLTEEAKKRVAPILDMKGPGLTEIVDPVRRFTTAVVLENTIKELKNMRNSGDQYLDEAGIPVNAMGSSSSTAGAGPIDTFDPILISLLRRAMPNLMAYDTVGVQPMSGPNGIIFAMRSRYSNTTGANGTFADNEALFNEPNTAFSSVVSGANTLGNKDVPGSVNGAYTANNYAAASANAAAQGTYNYATGMTRAQAEALGTTGNSTFAEMGFSIEKSTVTAVTRALAAGYTSEFAQDLKAIHGLEAEQELASMLATEILAEINREIIRTINITGEVGSQNYTTTPGLFDLDTDSNGRWMGEKYKGLMMNIELEANQIAIRTRRGKGNFVICSSDVASALRMTGLLTHTPNLNTNNGLTVDATGNTFAGILNGAFRLYVDPYAPGNYYTVGYKGPSSWDAGIFYCPYIPLQKFRAVDPQSFDPRIAFKTRYGMIANPYAHGQYVDRGQILVDSNRYYRKSGVANLL